MQQELFNIMNRHSVITFHYQADNFRLREAGQLKSWLAEVASKFEYKVATLTYVFVTDEALLEMNRIHLQHDYYTDIITFDLSEGETIEGELYISVDRVRDNAKSLGISATQEMRRVLAHGLLHLCGLGDKTSEEILNMRQAEEEALHHFLKK